MNTIKELIHLFESNQFEKAFSGNQGFFIRDHTWGVHDTILIFYHLFNWLKSNNNQSAIIELKKLFKRQILEDRSISEIDGSLNAIRLIRTYCIEAKDQKYWPIDQEFFEQLLVGLINSIKPNELEKFKVKKDMEQLEKYLPKLFIDWSQLG